MLELEIVRFNLYLEQNKLNPIICNVMGDSSKHPHNLISYVNSSNKSAIIFLDFPKGNVLCEAKHTDVLTNFCSKCVNHLFRSWGGGGLIDNRC